LSPLLNISKPSVLNTFDYCFSNRLPFLAPAMDKNEAYRTIAGQRKAIHI